MPSDLCILFRLIMQVSFAATLTWSLISIFFMVLLYVTVTSATEERRNWQMWKNKNCPARILVMKQWETFNIFSKHLWLIPVCRDLTQKTGSHNKFYLPLGSLSLIMRTNAFDEYFVIVQNLMCHLNQFQIQNKLNHS